LLLSKGPGTFMLRFSDSKLGGISTAYAARNEDGSIEVKHLEPDTLKILQVDHLRAIESVHDCFFRSEVWLTWSKISPSSSNYSRIGQNTTRFQNSTLRSQSRTGRTSRKRSSRILKIVKLA